MTLALVDWIIIGAYFAASAAIGVWYSKRGGQSVSDFFLSGRNLPWWLAGTSMVATTFAADTPLAVAGLVARNGIAGNWIWWSAAFGSMLTVFFFARLWRRAGILTDVEFAELRYTGRPAAILRGFRALYLGIPINCVIMGWVNLAMAKILAVTLGWDRLTAVLLSLAITGIYSALSGLWGVVITDFFQFLFAMSGTIALAWFAVRLPEIGGLDGLIAKVPPGTLSFTPFVTTSASDTGVMLIALPLASFLTYVCVQWWASWYPGQEPGGGGYVAQRMMSARDERHSFFATLWFSIAHYCVRPWPWIVVGLVSVVLYPGIEEMVVGAIVTFYLESIRQAWEFVLESGAGIGLVLILRWYWWRINAWSEITAMIAAAAGYAALKIFTTLAFPYTLLAVVAWTTVWWLSVTMMTAPESDEHLVKFYRRTRPDGPGWQRIAAIAGGPPPAPLAGLLVDWICGVALIYSVLFGIGQALLGSVAIALIFFGVAALAVAVISRDLSRRGWKSIVQ